ncbi:FecR family protein [Maribacter ulvicola]|uniref:FecR family protein n=1 Tax=Maribacter ulvicola TaxID=228959 RepID=A0A1N6RR96_9FLAO|nr:FecR domain-containing protein [Maribacter ulvicola]SIQ31236.1 FecR family protein [Maribacter ulvicola]
MSNEKQLKLALEHLKMKGKLDSEDLKKLSDDDKQIIYELYNKGLLNESFLLLNKVDTSKDWTTIKAEITKKETQSTLVMKSALKYAAIFIGIISAFFMFQKEKYVLPTYESSENSITLRVDNTNTTSIDETDVKRNISFNGKPIGLQRHNTIRYYPNSEIDEVIFNELQVPLGKIFNIELSDGTFVHLNSGTTIKYPIKFLKGIKREVYIKGEAYFKVAKDTQHPFIVNADAVGVEVLGTEFNITSYPEDKEINTVLIEGSVDMTNSYYPNQSTILKPGNQGSWNKTNHNTTIEEVDVEIYTGWITGELIFRDEPFSKISQKLERRYNIIIKNNNKELASKMLNANLNVNIESIEDILKSLMKIQPFTYKIVDGIIFIS